VEIEVGEQTVFPGAELVDIQDAFQPLDHPFYAWLDRYQATGCRGLKVHPGRGRKPAFSPSARDGGSGPRRVATPWPA
jgi:hypothetical protein